MTGAKLRDAAIVGAHTLDMSDPEREVFRVGYRDGRTHPDDAALGMTYDESRLNEVYDAGVTVGQTVARLGGVPA